MPALSKDLEKKIEVSLRDSEAFKKSEEEFSSEIRKAGFSIPRFTDLFGMKHEKRICVLSSILHTHVHIIYIYNMYIYHFISISNFHGSFTLLLPMLFLFPYATLSAHLFLQGQLALRRLAKESQCEAEDPDKLYKDELSDHEGKKPKGRNK